MNYYEATDMVAGLSYSAINNLIASLHTCSNLTEYVLRMKLEEHRTNIEREDTGEEL